MIFAYPANPKACDQRDGRTDRKAEFRCRLAMRRRARERSTVEPKPRYDDVFAEGTRWLDEHG